MYDNRRAFEAAVFACDPPYIARALVSIKVAWQIYQAAQRTSLNFLILGRWVGENDPDTGMFVGNSDTGNPGIDPVLMQNLNTVGRPPAVTGEWSDKEDYLTGGSIMNSGRWTILVNDSLILGGVHSHTQFQLASQRSRENIYKPTPAGDPRLTVTGRELVGLAVFGYRIYKLPIGEVGVCVDPALANKASFSTYRQRIAQYTVDSNWEELTG